MCGNISAPLSHVLVRTFNEGGDELLSLRCFSGQSIS
jgi:hypothetical protein